MIARYSRHRFKVKSKNSSSTIYTNLSCNIYARLAIFTSGRLCLGYFGLKKNCISRQIHSCTNLAHNCLGVPSAIFTWSNRFAWLRTSDCCSGTPIKTISDWREGKLRSQSHLAGSRFPGSMSCHTVYGSLIFRICRADLKSVSLALDSLLADF